MPTPPVFTDPAQIAEAVLLYCEHEWTIADIADYFDVSSSTIKRRLLEAGVALRASNRAAPELRMRQCTCCLHFLPVSLFSYSIKQGKRKPQSWCTSCTNTQKDRPRPWTTNPEPLTSAVNTWSRLQ